MRQRKAIIQDKKIGTVKNISLLSVAMTDNIIADETINYFLFSLITINISHLTTTF